MNSNRGMKEEEDRRKIKYWKQIKRRPNRQKYPKIS